MRAALAVLLLLTALLAGCADGGKGGDGDATSSSTTTSGIPVPTGSGTSSSSTSATGTTGPAANNPPTGSIAAAINGTSVRFNMTGSDADGDALSWTLAFGDGNATSGTSLPANVTHTFKAGNHTAVYNVTDGRLTTSYNLTVSVTNATGAASGPTQAVKGSWPVGAFGCGAEYEVFPAPLAEGSGGAYFVIEVAGPTLGQPYTMTMTWESTPVALGGDISFYDADGAFIDGNLVSGSSPLAFAGTVPAGAAFAVTTVCDVPGAEISYTA